MMGIIPTNEDAIYAIIRILSAIFDALDDGILDARYILRRIEDPVVTNHLPEGQKEAIQCIVDNIFLMLESKNSPDKESRVIN